MREVISRLMMTMDEAWLTHADRIRSKCTVTEQDVRYEDALFRFETALQKAQNDLAPKKRMPDTVVPAPGRRLKPLGSQRQ